MCWCVLAWKLPLSDATNTYPKQFEHLTQLYMCYSVLFHSILYYVLFYMLCCIKELISLTTVHEQVISISIARNSGHSLGRIMMGGECFILLQSEICTINCAICSRLQNGQHRYRYDINMYPTCSTECYMAEEDQGTVFPAWKPRHHHSLSIN